MQRTSGWSDMNAPLIGSFKNLAHFSKGYFLRADTRPINAPITPIVSAAHDCHKAVVFSPQSASRPIILFLGKSGQAIRRPARSRNRLSWTGRKFSPSHTGPGAPIVRSDAARKCARGRQMLKLEEPPPDRAPTAGELGRMSDVAGLQTARPVAYISRLLSPRGVCNSCVIAHRKHGSSGDGFGRGLTA
jgi:hypothetical protein